MICNGMRVIQSPALAKYEPPIKTWVDKVLEWNPCNHWFCPPTEVVTDVIIDSINNVIYMSPATFEQFRLNLNSTMR